MAQAEAGASLSYEFGIKTNVSDGGTTINVLLGLDACARLLPIMEECLSKYIPTVFPVVFFNETVDAGQVCGGGPSAKPTTHCVTAAPGVTWQCTPHPCFCDASDQRKVVHSFGNPATECWSCQDNPGGSSESYDDDDDLATRELLRTSARQLPAAPWPTRTSGNSSTATAPASFEGNTSMAMATGMQIDDAFVPWGVLKHAGWNEPCNRFRSADATTFYINKWAPIPGAPSDLPSLRAYAQAHRVRRRGGGA